VTAEDDFHQALDAHPDDWQTRLVLADFLQERGDPRADGYRAIATLRRSPLLGVSSVTMCWWHCDSEGAVPRARNTIPPDWFALLPSGTGSAMFWPLLKEGGVNNRSRRECEDALARAFAGLPDGRRAELLAPPAEPEVRA
jgi:uncharacterized protein (TIGR02996 family)